MGNKIFVSQLNFPWATYTDWLRTHVYNRRMLLENKYIMCSKFIEKESVSAEKPYMWHPLILKKIQYSIRLDKNWRLSTLILFSTSSDIIKNHLEREIALKFYSAVFSLLRRTFPKDNRLSAWTRLNPRRKAHRSRETAVERWGRKFNARSFHGNVQFLSTVYTALRHPGITWCSCHRKKYDLPQV